MSIKVQSKEGESMDLAIETPKTLYRPDVVQQIKVDVLRVWERVKENKNLKQAGLARALGMTQGSVSKVLNDPTGHPWTATHLQKFCEFCGVSIKEIVDDDLIGFFTGWGVDAYEPSEEFTEECVAAISQFYSDRGLPTRRDKIYPMAAILSQRLDGMKVDSKEMAKQVERVILEHATL